MNESRPAYEWVMSQIWMCHITHTNKPSHKHEWVMSQINRPNALILRLGNNTHMDESRPTYGWVMSQMKMRYITHTNESCHTYEWVMSHINRANALLLRLVNNTHMDESRPAYEWVISPIGMCCITHTNKPSHWYGVATMSRLLKNIGLFCKRALFKRRYSAKETYNSIDPTDCSQLIRMSHVTNKQT